MPLRALRGEQPRPRERARRRRRVPQETQQLLQQAPWRSQLVQQRRVLRHAAGHAQDRKAVFCYLAGQLPHDPTGSCQVTRREERMKQPMKPGSIWLGRRHGRDRQRSGPAENRGDCVSLRQRLVRRRARVRNGAQLLFRRFAVHARKPIRHAHGRNVDPIRLAIGHVGLPHVLPNKPHGERAVQDLAAAQQLQQLSRVRHLKRHRNVSLQIRHRRVHRAAGPQVGKGRARHTGCLLLGQRSGRRRLGPPVYARVERGRLPGLHDTHEILKRDRIAAQMPTKELLLGPRADHLDLEGWQRPGWIENVSHTGEQALDAVDRQERAVRSRVDARAQGGHRSTQKVLAASPRGWVVVRAGRKWQGVVHSACGQRQAPRRRVEALVVSVRAACGRRSASHQPSETPRIPQRVQRLEGQGDTAMFETGGALPLRVAIPIGIALELLHDINWHAR
eukprot:scaffold213_cov245-Pinguiococcus_pyrenoidosus.AAC.7